MKTIAIIILVCVLSAGALFSQTLPKYQLTTGNPVLSGNIYQFDLYISHISGPLFHLGNSQYILTFDTSEFTAPAISRVSGSEQMGSGFFFDQVIAGNQILLTIGGSGSYAGSSSILSGTPGTRIGTYRMSGVSAAVVSANLRWVNLPAVIRTGVSIIDASNNYTDITDTTGTSHLNGGAEFSGYSGYIFEDLNGDGSWQQPGEPGQNGWTVTLSGPGGVLQATTGSGTWPEGYFEFTNLTPGTWVCTESVQGGWSPTVAPANPVNLLPGVSFTGALFGNYFGPAFLGTVREDRNGNGIADVNDAGIAGWGVTAKNLLTSAVKTHSSNINGQYAFTFLPSETGTWVVSADSAGGWVQTVPSPVHQYTIDVQSGTYSTGNDFLLFHPASITGKVVNDLAGDSLETPGDPPLAGWMVTLDRNGIAFDSVATDSAGTYAFAGLMPASYSVRANLPTGWIRTFPAGTGAYSEDSVAGGVGLTGRDFGNFHLGTISGTVYSDVNHNGQRDSGETGLAGMTVAVTGPGGVNNVLTLPGGGWSVTGLMAGLYSIGEQIPSGYHVIQPSGGVYSVNVSSGFSAAGFDFGNSAASDTVVFRTFTYEDFALAYDTHGKIGYPVKRTPDKNEFRLRLVNDAARKVNGLHIDFRYGQFVTGDSTKPFIVTPLPSKVVIAPRHKRLDLTWPDSLTPGQLITISAWRLKGNAEGALYYWTLDGKIRGAARYLNPKDFEYDFLRLPMPNAVNPIDECFTKGGFPTGLNVGRPMNTGFHPSGWVHLRALKYVRSSFFQRGILHTVDNHGLDVFVNGRAISGELKQLPPTVQDNRCFADLAALKINIASSSLGFIPGGLGDLIFDDGVNPLSGRTLTSIAALGDSMMSLWQSYSAERFINLDTTVHRILTAFHGPVDTISFGSALRFKGVRRLQDVAFLRGNPSALSTLLNPVASPEAALPSRIELFQNYPNPFNPVTTIRFSLPSDAVVTLTVYTILGQQVGFPVRNEMMTEGESEIQFDGASLASGVYLYRLSVKRVDENGELLPEEFLSGKMILLR
jgi:hypothetical protein